MLICLSLVSTNVCASSREVYQKFAHNSFKVELDQYDPETKKIVSNYATAVYLFNNVFATAGHAALKNEGEGYQDLILYSNDNPLRTYIVKPVVVDRIKDIAILKMPNADFDKFQKYETPSPIEWNSQSIVPGDTIYSFGYTNSFEGIGLMDKGYISKAFDTINNRTIYHYAFLDGIRGKSGMPVYNENGKFLGIFVGSIKRTIKPLGQIDIIVPTASIMKAILEYEDDAECEMQLGITTIGLNTDTNSTTILSLNTGLLKSIGVKENDYQIEWLNSTIETQLGQPLPIKSKSDILFIESTSICGEEWLVSWLDSNGQKNIRLVKYNLATKKYDITVLTADN